MVTREFHQPDDLAGLTENVLISSTGLGSQALFGDRRLRPVRGQLSFLIPQPELRYSFSNNDAYVIPRRDGVVVGSNDNGKIDSNDTEVDPRQTYAAVAAIARSMQPLANCS